MRALTACPAEPGSVRLQEVPEPAEEDGLLLIGKTVIQIQD
jgi:hypothetical protein